MSLFRAGATRRTITPDPLLPVSRGADACRPALEKRGELELRVLVVESGSTRVAMASVPFLGFPSRLCQRVREKVEGIPPENILIGATHCHSAPDPYGFPNGEGEYEISFPYLYGACDALADAINEAVASLQPAVLRTATGAAQGKIAYNYYAPELYDPRCHVIQCLTLTGKAIATLVNYAIHPEILLHQDVCSPDLVGPLYDRIEALGGGTAIFMNSAQGGMVTADIRTPQGDLEDWSECLRIGRLLAEEAMRIAGDAPVQEHPQLWCGAQAITFPVGEIMGQMMLMLHPESREGRTEPLTEISAQQNLVNLGDAQILTIPGEALPNLGFYLKRKMRGRHTLLFGLTNDAFGYILSPYDYDSFKVYEYISATSLHESMGGILVTESLRFVNGSPKPEEADSTPSGIK